MPENAERNGKPFPPEDLWECPNDSVFRVYSDKKLLEEVREFLDVGAATDTEIRSRQLEELADIAEAFRTVCSAHGFSLKEVEAKRREKAAVRGKFKKRIIWTNAPD